MLTLVTPTGGRPTAFALCQMMMQRQNYDGPVRWIIVDDVVDETVVTLRRHAWQVVIIRPKPFWTKGQNTQQRNLQVGLQAAIEYASQDASPLRLAIIEDDDWYDKDWLRWVNDGLNNSNLLGEAPARYYNVGFAGFDTLNNLAHASLRATAMAGDAVAVFQNILQRSDVFYDIPLWAGVSDGVLIAGERSVGIKGLPGRAGICPAHRDYRLIPDADGAVLRQWVGDEFDHYAPFLGALAKEPKFMTQTRSMVVVKPMKYGTRRLVAGDTFVASRRDARVLVAIGKAREEIEPQAPAPVRAQTELVKDSKNSNSKTKTKAKTQTKPKTKNAQPVSDAPKPLAVEPDTTADD